MVGFAEKLKKMRGNMTFRRPAGALLLGAMLLASCSMEDSDINMMPGGRFSADALVTVRTSSTGASYFQVDDETTFEPKDWDNPFVKETRALLTYTELKDASAFCDKLIRVERIDSVLTKDAEYQDKFPLESPLGILRDSDPVEIVTNNGFPDWLTISEDGYFTIHFATYWGGVASHSVNLYASKNNPDHLYFIHRDNGDYQRDWDEGLVAFRIDQLYAGRKDAYGSPDSVTLHWWSFDGERTMVFKYGPRIGTK